MLLDQYTDLLKAQLPLYAKLMNEIIKQEKSINQGDYVLLNQVLMQKDALLKQIDELEAQAKVIRDELMRRHSLLKFNLTELGGVYSAGRLAPLKEIMDDLKSCMQAMLEKEKQNEGLLREKMDEVEAGMRQLRVGKQVNNAYQSLASVYGASAFMDKKQ